MDFSFFQETFFCSCCGGPITLREGDSITINSTFTYGPDGELLDEEHHADWCPDCQRSWEERVCSPAPG